MNSKHFQLRFDQHQNNITVDLDSILTHSLLIRSNEILKHLSMWLLSAKQKKARIFENFQSNNCSNRARDRNTYDVVIVVLSSCAFSLFINTRVHFIEIEKSYFVKFFISFIDKRTANNVHREICKWWTINRNCQTRHEWNRRRISNTKSNRRYCRTNQQWNRNSWSNITHSIGWK